MRVGVLGATGRMGRSSCHAVLDASDLELVATLAAARLLLPAGVHVVSGTTGLPAASIEELASLADEAGAGNLVWAPNFALGAVLAQRFATIAARYYQAAEVIELHHPGKADAPSGTALRTAKGIAEARRRPGSPVPPGRELVTGARGGDVEGVRVHSVRLPGLVAHQEIIFGGEGELLTL